MDKALDQKKDGIIKVIAPPKEVKPSKEDKKLEKEQAKADKHDEKLKFEKMAKRMSIRVLDGQKKSKRNPKELVEACEAELKRRKSK